MNKFKKQKRFFWGAAIYNSFMKVYFTLWMCSCCSFLWVGILSAVHFC